MNMISTGSYPNILFYSNLLLMQWRAQVNSQLCSAISDIRKCPVPMVKRSKRRPPSLATGVRFAGNVDAINTGRERELVGTTLTQGCIRPSVAKMSSRSRSARWGGVPALAHVRCRSHAPGIFCTVLDCMS